MAKDLFEEKKISDMDRRWEMVREHYEVAYHIKFKKRLSDEKIIELYKAMRKLDAAYRNLKQ